MNLHTVGDQTMACGIVVALREEFSDKDSFAGFQRTFATGNAFEQRGRQFFPFHFTDRDSQTRNGIATVLYGMGNALAADATRDMLELFNPALMVNVGISGAVASHLNLGDVVVGELSEDYETNGAVADVGDDKYRMEFDGSPYRATGALFYNVETFETGYPEVYREWQRLATQTLEEGAKPAELKRIRNESLVGASPKIAAGSLAAGNKVVKSIAFAQELKSRRRKLMAVDMESAGFLRACTEGGERARIVLRAISDFADPRKDRLDAVGDNVIRAWAMSNVYDLLLRLLGNALPITRPPAESVANTPATQESALEHEIEQLSRKFLKKRYQTLCISSSDDIDAFNKLFRFILKEPAGITGRDVFQRFAEYINVGHSRLTIRVEGEPGSGKTTFLNLLYLWLLHLRANSETPLPVYIDLTYYDQPDYRGTQAELVKRLSGDLQPLRSLLARGPGPKVVLLIDGVNEYIKTARPLVRELLVLVGHERLQRVVGVGLNYMPNEEHFRTRYQEFDDADHVCVLDSVATDSADLPAFIATMQEVTTGGSPQAVRDLILQSINNVLHLPSLDLITCSLLLKFIPRRKDAIRSLADIYSLFCEDILNKDQRAVTVLAAAELAFRYAIRQDVTSHGDATTKAQWRLIHRHRLVKDYLIALHVIETFKKVGKGHDDCVQDLEYVYPQEINQFAKQIFLSDSGIQSEVFLGVRRAYEMGKAAAKTHACYMAGRVRAADVGARRRAIGFLNECRDRFERNDAQPDDRHTLLLGRTIYISLAYLNDGPAADTYLGRIMQDRRWDELNRGFHLEYFGDIPYDPRDPETMAHEDPVEERSDVISCDRTFDRLHSRILAKTPGTSAGLRDIEVFTLFSLAQHRHAVGVLSDDHRTALRNLVPHLLDTRVSVRLRPYLDMMYDHLQRPRFYRCEPLGRLYRLKNEERTGWIGNVSGARIESVADHTLLTVYLGKLHLPDAYPEEPGYDKYKILDLLLYHDIGEFKGGDHITAHRTAMQQDEEGAAARYLGACGTYLHMPDLRDIPALQNEFEHSDHINSRAARDIDRLEYYNQLNHYRPHLPGGFAPRKEREVEVSLETPIGRMIFETLREPFAAGPPLSFENLSSPTQNDRISPGDVVSPKKPVAGTR